MKNGYELIVPTHEESEYIGKSLLRFNLDTIPLSQETPFIDINKCVKDETGEVVGGILSCLALWNVLSIDTLWVKAEFRSQGIAKQLLSLVEIEAKTHGCHLAYLSTYEFQAKDFYVNNGYIVFGVLDDCPKGHKLYHLSKKL